MTKETDYSKYQTVGDKVLIKIDYASSRGSKLIADPYAGQRKTPFGVVYSQGEQCVNDLIGKRCLYDIHEGWRLDDDWLVIAEQDLKAVLSEED